MNAREEAPRWHRTDELVHLAACFYVSRGWPVLPLFGVDGRQCKCESASCTSRGKHPRTIHGFHDATTDRDQVDAWFDQTRPGHLAGSNIAIRTGPFSDLVVIDIDPRNGGDESWIDVEAMAANREIDLTSRTVVTGSGGTHVYYHYPRDRRIPSRGNFLPGIDCKADGGYVVAPPSLHASGQTYRWRDTTTPIAFPSELVLELLESAPGGCGNGGRGSPLGYDVSLEAVIGGTARVPVGQRDAVFFALACRLRGAGIDIHEAIEILGRIHENQCDEPETFTRHDVAEKCQRAFDLYEPNTVSDAFLAWARSASKTTPSES
jgi:putative DNA primase/helicase